MVDNNNQNNSSEPIDFPNFSNLEKVQDLLDNNRQVNILNSKSLKHKPANWFLFEHTTIYRLLLQQIKANHDAQRPEGLAKNFALIQDVNANIDKVSQ